MNYNITVSSLHHNHNTSYRYPVEYCTHYLWVLYNKCALHQYHITRVVMMKSNMHYQDSCIQHIRHQGILLDSPIDYLVYSLWMDVFMVLGQIHIRYKNIECTYWFIVMLIMRCGCSVQVTVSVLYGVLCSPHHNMHLFLLLLLIDTLINECSL